MSEPNEYRSVAGKINDQSSLAMNILSKSSSHDIMSAVHAQMVRRVSNGVTGYFKRRLLRETLTDE